MFQIHGEGDAADLVIKLYRHSRSDPLGVKPLGARKAVRAYFNLLPVPSPKPLYWDTLVHPEFSSLLVYEFADGPTLRKLIADGGGAPIEVLPVTLAAIYKTGFLHGDLHALNLVWTNGAWTVLDLDGARGGLHKLRRKPIWERTWARLASDFGDEDTTRKYFLRFAKDAELNWDLDATWRRVLELHEDLLIRRKVKMDNAAARRAQSKDT